MKAIVHALAQAAAGLSRHPLGLLAFCFLVAQVTACLVLLEGAPGPEAALLLSGFLVVNGPCVYAAIVRLVSRHHTKLYAPADYRSEGTFLEVLRCAEPAQAQPLGSISIIAGDDFNLLQAAPPANGLTAPEPGMHVRGDEAYFVSWRQRVFLVRHPGERPLPREVQALPAGCRLLARRDWDGEMQRLADAAERFAGG